MRIEGEKIFLDTLTEDGLLKVMEWKNDRELSELILAQYKPTNLEDVKEWYAKNSSDINQLLLGIYHRETNSLIGLSRLMFITRPHNHAEFGIYIGENAFKGQGLGHEAIKLTFNYGFNTLNLHKIFLKVDEVNLPATKAYARVGMTREGVLREHHLIGDSYRNVVLFGMLGREFNSKYPPSEQK